MKYSSLKLRQQSVNKAKREKCHENFTSFFHKKKILSLWNGNVSSASYKQPIFMTYKKIYIHEISFYSLAILLA